MARLAPVAVVLAAACAPAPLPPLPAETVVTGVTAAGEGWTAAAPVVALVAGEARAEDVVVSTTQGGPPLQIAAARSSWSFKSRSARFEGDVRVVRGDVEMTCASLYVGYAGANRVELVVATGGVTVRRGDRVATAERAELDGRTGRIVLTGKPRLAEGVNTLEGARIELFLDDERATCEGAEGEACRLVVEGSALGR